MTFSRILDSHGEADARWFWNDWDGSVAWNVNVCGSDVGIWNSGSASDVPGGCVDGVVIFGLCMVACGC